MFSTLWVNTNLNEEIFRNYLSKFCINAYNRILKVQINNVLQSTKKQNHPNFTNQSFYELINSKICNDLNCFIDDILLCIIFDINEFKTLKITQLKKNWVKKITIIIK